MGPKGEAVCAACGEDRNTLGHEERLAVNLCPAGWMTDAEIEAAKGGR